MIAKGTTHDNGARLARYLTTGKDGEIAALWELSGFASDNIVEAFRSVHIMAAGTQCEHPFFHIQVRNRETEYLTRDQWLIVADRIERILGLSGQPRAIAFHTERLMGGEHMHLAFSRIDHETLTARKLPFFKRKLNMASRELENELGLTPVRAHRASVIKYAPLRPQEEQARRLGVDIRDVLQTIRECFDRSDCGRAFAAALTRNELTLAQGERRDFIVVDHVGGIHAIGKRILGLSAAQIRARLSDLAKESLPTVDQARQRISVLKGSRKKQAAEKSRYAGQHPRLPAPAIEMKAAATTTLPATDDRPDWFVRPTLRTLTTAQHEPVLPGPAPSLNREIVPNIPVCEIGQIQYALSALGPEHSTADLAHKPPEPEAEQTPGAHGKRAGLADILKKQFRAVAQALVRRTPSLQPQARRRRRGETVGSFRSAARQLLRPIVQLPVISRTFAFLSDTLPWLHMWEWNAAAEQDLTEEPGGREGNHLSPHP
jgi:hypothetical protein